MKLYILKVILLSIPFLEIRADKTQVYPKKVLVESHSLTVEQKYGDRIELLGVKFKDPLVLCQILIAVFFIITFIQSGLDKVIDRRGNIVFFRDHFLNSFLKNYTSIALTFLTLLELICGLVLIYGVYFSFNERTTLWIFYGFVICAFNLIFLFLGQRIAKDYVGASDLVPYIILVLLGIMSMY
jgi:putative oxidoreductase